MEKKSDRPESYPKPSQADNQFNNQNEFIEQKPNEFEDTSVNKVSTQDETERSRDANRNKEDVK